MELGEDRASEDEAEAETEPAEARAAQQQRRFRNAILQQDRRWAHTIFLGFSILLSATATLVGSANAGDFGEKIANAIRGNDTSSDSTAPTTSENSKAVHDLFWTLSYATFFLSGTKLNYITFFFIYWLIPNTRHSTGTVLKAVLWLILAAVCTLPNIFFSIDASDRYEEVRRELAAKIGGPIQSFLFNIFSCSLIFFFFKKYIFKRKNDENKQVETIRETLIYHTALTFGRHLTPDETKRLAEEKFHSRYLENHNEEKEIVFASTIAILSIPYLVTHLAATVNGLIDFFKAHFAASTTGAEAGASILGALSTLMIACFSLYACYRQSKKLYQYLYGVPILQQAKNAWKKWLTCLILFTCFICTSSSANLVHEYLFVEWAGHDETDLGVMFAAWTIAFFGTWLGYSLFSIEAAHELPYLFKPAPFEMLIRKISQMPLAQLRATATTLGLSVTDEDSPLLAATAVLTGVNEDSTL